MTPKNALHTTRFRENTSNNHIAKHGNWLKAVEAVCSCGFHTPVITAALVAEE